MSELRIGQGYDLHRLAPGRRLVLGGVEIPTSDGVGLLGHSDADALLHAITDAVLGALAQGDIGQWFPDTSPEFAGVDSRELLLRVLSDKRLAGWQLVNLDCTVVAQRPKLMPHILQIRQSIAELFGVSMEQISVKAKTNEGLDAVGHGEAIAAYAVVLMTRAKMREHGTPAQKCAST